MVALEDRGCHRSLPQSRGKLNGDKLRFGYHGLLYNPDGKCIEVPGQNVVPPEASVRIYPVAERYNLVWVWMGNPEQVDTATIPNLHWLDDPNFLTKPGYLHLAYSYQLMKDNLLDLSHLTFLHSQTIGAPGNAETAAKVERSGNSVTVSRWMMDIPPSPTWKQLGIFDGNVDRCQIVNWKLGPSTVSIDLSGAPAGTGGPNGVRGNGIEMYNLSIVTPETRNSSHYLWSQALGPGINGKLELNDFF